ncbi:ABC transporter ATP-binding protein [Micrococcus terreus]|uniref:ABC transporter ATP-binding protein n=1 Tax=Micrococcus terreus TaxID=574650 RepID=UPI0035CCFD68
MAIIGAEQTPGFPTTAPHHCAPAAVPRGARVQAQGWGWKHAGRDRPAVAGLEMDIPAGQRVLLVGPSGAGKSTVLHALAGVLDGGDEESEQTGTLLIEDIPAGQQRGVAGLVQQDPESQVILSRVGDDVAFGAENLCVPRAEIWDRVRDALQEVGLGPEEGITLDRDTSRLSGGQKQRMALAGILAMRPPLVLLDEPTANLDPEGVLEVRDAVMRLVERTGATLVVVEHRLDVWADQVDRMLVLEPAGGISHDAAPTELLAPGPVRDELAAAGIWVPGFVPEPVELESRALRRVAEHQDPQHDSAPADSASAPEPSDNTALLTGTGLSVSREPLTPGWRRRFSAPPAPAQTDLDVELDGGSAVVVTGPNGAGKSTLLLSLAGLIPVHAGTLAAGAALKGPRGADLPDDPFRWKAADLVSRVGTVFQEPEHQFVTTTVRKEVLYGPQHARDPRSGERLFTDEEAEQMADDLLELLGLTHLGEMNPFTLSGGEKRRLSVATVLAAGPDLVFLDEPTFGQDANTWAVLTGLLRRLVAEGRSVVAVTHDRDFIDVLDARVVALR